MYIVVKEQSQQGGRGGTSVGTADLTVRTPQPRAVKATEDLDYFGNMQK